MSLTTPQKPNSPLRPLLSPSLEPPSLSSAHAQNQPRGQERPWPHVHIVLLQYTKAHLTLACLESLYKLQYPSFDIWVVDNQSPDGAYDTLQEALAETPPPISVTLRQSPGNLGYSGGNNVALVEILQHHVAHAPESYAVWLLNNDTTVDPKALHHLMDVSFQEQGPSGVPPLVGSRLLNPDGTLQQAGLYSSSWLGQTRLMKTTEAHDGHWLPGMSGCSMLVHGTTLLTLGTLAEDYFLYYEDIEYCMRANQQGVGCKLAWHSVVYHHESATTGKTSPYTSYYYNRNRVRIFWDHGNPLQKALLFLLFSMRFARNWLRSFKSEERRKFFQVLVLAYQDAMKGVTGKCPHNLNHLIP